MHVLEDLFVDEYDQSLKIDTKLTSDIPTQFPDAATKEAVESTASLLKSGSSGIFANYIFLNIFMAASLQYLWDVINAQ